MHRTSWIRRILGRSRQGSLQRYLPRLESLEDRTTPTGLPEGFSELPIIPNTALNKPTAMEFSPTGQLWVLEQTGAAKVVNFAAGNTATAGTLPVNSSGERGLLGIAFPADYDGGGPNVDHVYLYYTATTPIVHNRVSVFEVNNAGTAGPTLGAETVILDIEPEAEGDGSTNHNGGAIHFGPDGKLYVAIGDHNADGPNFQGANHVSQRLDYRHGKILRINPDGSNPSDNPFFVGGDPIRDAVYVLGLRNPYTFTFQPGTGRLFINDVGENNWEEINDGIAGSNYGWASETTPGGYAEGFVSSPPSYVTIGTYRNPLMAYDHSNSLPSPAGCAITGGVFYPSGGAFGSAFAGKYFFADYCGGFIRTFNPAAPGSLGTPDTSTSFADGVSTGSPVDLKLDAAGNLYFLAGAGSASGAIYRISLRQSTWDGGGADSNWTTAANWDGDVAPQAGSALVFPTGAARLVNTNNFPAGTQFSSITFSGSGYSISGNGVVLASGVANAAGSNVLNLSLTFSTGQAFTAGASSSLQVGGAVSNGGFLLKTDSGPSAAITLSGAISGAGGLWKTGAGALTLSGNNSFSGSTLLGAGTLAIGSNSAVGAGTLTLQTATIQTDGTARTLANPVVLSGTTTFAGSFPLTFTGAVSLTANRTLQVTNTDVTIFSGNISQSGGAFKLGKTGPGTLVFSGNNSFSGGFTLSAGTLAVGSDTAAGSGTLILYGGALRADGAARTLANPLTWGGNVTFFGTQDLTLSGPTILTGNRTLTVANSGLTTLSGTIGQNALGRILIKAGPGTLVLSGNNSFSGGVKHIAGALAVGHNNALGTGPLTLQTASIRADGAPRTVANAVNLSGTITFAGTLDLTFTGAATLTANRTITVDNTGLTTFAGAIDQIGGSFKLGKIGAGTLLLSGNNSFSGGLTISAGTLAVGHDGAAGTGTLIFYGGGVRAEGASHTLANALTLGANITVSGANNLTFSGAAKLTGNRTLTVTSAGLTVISGNIGQDVAGRGLTKAGPGTLVLGGSNTFSGATTVTAGVLRVDGSQPSSPVTVKPGGTLAGKGTVGAVTVQAGGTLSPGASPGILTTGNLSFTASSTFVVELNGVSPGAGYDQISAAGAVNLGGTSLNLSSSFTPNVGTSFVLIDNDGADAVLGAFNGLAEGSIFSLGAIVFQISYAGGTGNDVVITRVS